MSEPTAPALQQQKPKANKTAIWVGIVAVIFIVLCISQSDGCNPPVSPAFDAGYQLGLTSGKVDGIPGGTPPSQTRLDFASREALKHSEYASGSDADKEKFTDGFKSGYEVGFKQASKPAF